MEAMPDRHRSQVNESLIFNAVLIVRQDLEFLDRIYRIYRIVFVSQLPEEAEKTEAA